MKRWQSDGILLLIVMLWGSTFFVVRDATDHWPPLAFVALRFSLATLALLPWAIKSFRQWTRTDWQAGLITGGLLCVGYITQTIGISMTTASRAGFVTGLNVIFVPLMGAVLWRTKISAKVWVGVVLAVVGLYVLSLAPAAQAGSQPVSLWGDFLVFICAITFAGHILAIGHWTKKASPIAMNLIQVAVVAIVATLGSLLFETVPALPVDVFWAGAYLGIICTAVLLAIQIIVQRYASPTRTALIFVLEPVFAALFAATFGNETISSTFVWGGLLMMLGIVIAELPPLAIFKKQEPNETV